MNLNSSREPNVSVLEFELGECDLCGKRAELERITGYESFQMCPHCAHMTRQHSKNLRSKNFE